MQYDPRKEFDVNDEPLKSNVLYDKSYQEQKIHFKHSRWTFTLKNKLLAMMAVILLVIVVGGYYLPPMITVSIDQPTTMAVSHSQSSSSTCNSSGIKGLHGKTMKLPGAKLQETIADMKPGEKGYTVPWALIVFPDKTTYLDISFDLSEDGGTVTMQVIRTRTGYKVILPSDYQYTISGSTDMCNLVPVEGIQ